jgi:hypothetical protein
MNQEQVIEREWDESKLATIAYSTKIAVENVNIRLAKEGLSVNINNGFSAFSLIVKNGEVCQALFSGEE